MVEQRLINDAQVKVGKIKPKIIREKRKGEKPYYSIVYYDFRRGCLMNGYGSYYKNNVKKWLRDEFIAVTRLDFEELLALQKDGEK